MLIYGLICIFIGFVGGLAFGTDFPFLEGLFANWVGSTLTGLGSGAVIAAWSAFVSWKLDAFQYFRGKAAARLGPMNPGAIFLRLMNEEQKAEFIKQAWEAADVISDSAISLRELHFDNESHVLWQQSLQLQQALKSNKVEDISDAIHKGAAQLNDLRAPIFKIATVIAAKWLLEHLRLGSKDSSTH